MPTYTPFIERNVDKTAGAIQQKQQKDLSSSAYMGDKQALEQLFGVNPALAERIQTKQAQSQQAKLSQQASRNKALHEIGKETINMDYEQAASYAQRRAREMGIEAPVMPREVHEQMKQAFGKQGGDSGAFGGTGMDAQVSNMLSRGVDDPEFRGSPEYARAWQLANEPKIIRTPTGDIILRPELSSIFKAPGDTSSPAEKRKEIESEAKKDVEFIKGTEKEIKTTADEKLSFGFLNRMEGAEENISKLGDFDSSDLWERMKGVTNISSSPELQQYRQAADDWIRAKLRRESGAVIGEDEMASEYRVYFPQIGDGQDVIDQKKVARDRAVKAMRVASGQEGKKQAKSASTDRAAPNSAIEFLRQNPQALEQFEAKYGYRPEGF